MCKYLLSVFVFIGINELISLGLFFIGHKIRNIHEHSILTGARQISFFVTMSLKPYRRIDEAREDIYGYTGLCR